MADVEFLGGNLVKGTVFCVVAGSIFVVVDGTGLWVVEVLGLVCVGLCVTVVVGLFKVTFEAVVAAVGFVASSVLGRGLNEVAGLVVGLLVVLGDALDGRLLAVLLGKMASVLEAPSLCTVWNVESRVVCVVVSIVTVVGFLVATLVASLNVVCALGLTGVVWNFADSPAGENEN